MADALSRVLIVDDSAVLREMLKLVFKVHCEEVLIASGVREAIETLDQNPEISLVISDVIMPDGSGFDLLRHVSSRDVPRPQVILLTGRPVEEDQRRATEMGAIGYLGKPTSFREINRALRRREAESWNAARPERRRTLGRAFLVDPARQGFSELAWEIHDLSRTGAFLETNAPLPVGTTLHLSMELGDATARVQVEVVRVQEPSWGRVGGVGVVFRDIDENARGILERHVAEAADQVY